VRVRDLLCEINACTVGLYANQVVCLCESVRIKQVSIQTPTLNKHVEMDPILGTAGAVIGMTVCYGIVWLIQKMCSPCDNGKTCGDGGGSVGQ
jgi:hypothetical protein